MSASVVLLFDKTPPVLTIHSPNYVTPDETVTIIIQANEPLLQFQLIYIVDSSGKRVDLIFSYQTNYFTGTIDFSQLSKGNATLYATLKDDVWNTTTVSKIIDINNHSELFLNVSEFINHVTVSDHLENLIKTTESTMELKLSEVTIS